MEHIKRKKRGLMSVLVILTLMATSSCATLRISKNGNMNHSQIDSTLIMNKFYVNLFEKNQKKGTWEYTATDGTKVRASGDGYPPYWYYVIELTPADDYYALVQLYDEYGNIKSRGKYSWESVRGLGGGVTKVGDWEYYDENGVKSVVNEDAAYGEFTYGDVLRKLESMRILDRRTRKNREDLDIYFHSTEQYWYVNIVNDAGTPEGRFRQIHFHKDTGRILEDMKGPFRLIY